MDDFNGSFSDENIAAWPLKPPWLMALPKGVPFQADEICRLHANRLSVLDHQDYDYLISALRKCRVPVQAPLCGAVINWRPLAISHVRGSVTSTSASPHAEARAPEHSSGETGVHRQHVVA